MHKKLLELKAKRDGKINEMDVIFKGAQERSEKMNETEKKNYDTLKSEVADLGEEIREAQEHVNLLDKRAKGKKPTPKKDDFETEKKKYDMQKALRQYGEGEGKVTKVDGREAEIHQELRAGAEAAGATVKGIMLPYQYRANEQTMTTNANVIDNKLNQNLDIIVDKPMHQLIGCDMMRNAGKSVS